MEHHREKCPNCGRVLEEEEIYCYFCEADISELKKKQKHSEKEKHGR